MKLVTFVNGPHDGEVLEVTDETTFIECDHYDEDGRKATHRFVVIVDEVHEVHEGGTGG